MLKGVLIILAAISTLGISACPRKDFPTAPKFPKVTFYGVHADLKDSPPGFYSEDEYISFFDEKMKAAQVLKADDYLKVEDWKTKRFQWELDHCK